MVLYVNHRVALLAVSQNGWPLVAFLCSGCYRLLFHHRKVVDDYDTTYDVHTYWLFFELLMTNDPWCHVVAASLLL